MQPRAWVRAGRSAGPQALSPLLVALVLACGGDDPEPVRAAPEPAPSPTGTADIAKAIPAELPTVDVALLRRHMEPLASDAFEGRRPGSPGGAKTVAYVEDQMRALGLEPAGDDGTYRQSVPMRALTVDPGRSRAALQPPRGQPVPLRALEDVVIGSRQEAGTTQFEAELVFAGYGVTAPELEWDDYAEIDVKDKIVVVLVGDPPVADGRFGGAVMTYYGRWTYKFERALSAGAAGCLVVHDTDAASYGWNVVQSSWSGERFDIAEPDGALGAALRLQGWIHADAADRLAQIAGGSLAKWREDALAAGFRARPTGVMLEGEVVTTERTLTDANVVGRIPGGSRAAQAVVITAHWDHLGTNAAAAQGDDAIFNGAVDNASGIAGMLATAAALQAHRQGGGHLERSVLFIATTGEEQGLLGSRYWVDHPAVALGEIAGVVNLDSMNVDGPTPAITVMGAGQSTLEDVLDEVARAQGRSLVPDEHPEAGSYYRSDHFSFAQRGVPALFFRGGPQKLDGGREALYHTVDDELEAHWPLTGALQDVEALTQLVIRVANGETMPTFKASSEFAGVAR